MEVPTTKLEAYNAGHDARWNEDPSRGRPVPPSSDPGSPESVLWAEMTREWWKGWHAAGDEIARGGS